MECTLSIVEQGGEAVHVEPRLGDVVVPVVSRFQLLEDRLLLYDLHVGRSGPGALGVSGLRRAVMEAMETFGVEVVEIRGFRRTTGAGPGRVPRPVVFRRRPAR